MNIKDEIYPKIKSEVRLSDDGTLWVKTDKKTFENAQRVIIEDGKTWCKQFYAEQPQRMHGKWEEKNVCDDKNVIEEWQSARCSVCGKYHTTPYMYYFKNYNFCPNCGDDKREEQRDE